MLNNLLPGVLGSYHCVKIEVGGDDCGCGNTERVSRSSGSLVSGIAKTLVIIIRSWLAIC